MNEFEALNLSDRLQHAVLRNIIEKIQPKGGWHRKKSRQCKVLQIK